MTKTIWILWLQGWSNAPNVALKCLASWQHNNPGWKIRALDLQSLRYYIEVPSFVDKRITPTSFSDIVRISLLHEYGGVWVDSTLLCNKSLDSWLPDVMNEGFFAFDQPHPDRMLSSWFLAAEEDNLIIDNWASAVYLFWKDRINADEYFWFHNLFKQICNGNKDVANMWERVPKISANGPHYAQFFVGLGETDKQVIEKTLNSLPPVSKLTYKNIDDLLGQENLFTELLNGYPEPVTPAKSFTTSPEDQIIASLKVDTQNLGDHIQIIANEMLLFRLGHKPILYIDRDNEIASCSRLDTLEKQIPIVMNGWFKTNRLQWPPHPKLLPAFVGFHIRLFQCPELISETALEYYRMHSPIGCRDIHTMKLLETKQINSYVSNCLSITLKKRLRSLTKADQVFIVSRDNRIQSILPSVLVGKSKFLSHYSNCNDFDLNMKEAYRLLELYMQKASLIITTLLHCAIPAIAMGIPVVVFYPLNTDKGIESDQERFSTLKEMIPVYSLNDMEHVDWTPKPVKTARWKLQALDAYMLATQQWNIPMKNLDWKFTDYL